MEVSIVDLASIRTYERNLRLNDAAVDAVAKSLQECGFRHPRERGEGTPTVRRAGQSSAVC